ncbi:hypothetical protein Golob_004459 [Gossypium lobatum]|uniref:Uncharacterized protein n=2 Tax=Gossypium TaxID=3633 RepID=A0A7J8YAL7_GOSAI|nr:hypothetical protein [Gossypium lobatum]MBA0696587.1 hypothetical protein [Gossypium aridum]
MLIRSWEVHIKCIPHAQKTVADLLANIVDPELLRFHLLEEPLPLVRELLMVDSNMSALN